MTQETAGRVGSLVSGAALTLGMSALAARPAWALPLAPGVAPRAPLEVPSKAATELLVLDPRVAGHQAFLRTVRPRVAALVLDPQRDGLAQIAEALTAYPSVDVVHLVAHGEPGLLQLGATALTPESARAHGDPLRRWFRPRAPFERRPEVLLYGCSAAAGTRGQALIRTLASLTGADVAGSIDATGGATAGANWVLEAATGAIDASLPFRPDLAQAYPGTLETFQVSNTHSSGSGSLAQAVLDANRNDNGDTEVDTIVFTNSSCTDADAGVCDGDAGTLLTDGTVTGTIALGASLKVYEPLTIEGPGAGLLAIDGGRTLTIFHTTNTTMTVRGLTIQNGIHGIRVEGGSLAVDACIISGNDATKDLSKNVRQGGGIFGTEEANIAITDSTLSGNSASFRGGAVMTENCYLTIERSTISGNTSSFGGAIAIMTYGTSFLSNSTIDGNTASNWGGGIFTYGLQDFYVTAENVTISGNSAKSGAGVFIQHGGEISFDHATIAHNVDSFTYDCPGPLAGINAAGINACRLDPGHTVEVSNTIVAGNLLDDEDDGGESLPATIDLAGGTGQVEVKTSLIGMVSGIVTISGSNVLIGPDFDPGLGDLAENGGTTRTHALLYGSDAIDKADNPNNLTYDQRGQGFPRVRGDAADMGAFEWDPTSIVDAGLGEPDASMNGGSDSGIGGGTAGGDSGIGGSDSGTAGSDSGTGGGDGGATDAGVEDGSGTRGDGCGCSIPGGSAGGDTHAAAGGLFAALMGLLGWRSRKRR